MKLVEVILQNFRQFEGEHHLKFAQHDDRNVTVVYGANGSGKTTLLNAFTWVLYGHLSRDFMYPDRLVSDGVWSRLPSGESVVAAVILEFEHNGDYFTLRRTARLRKPTATSVQERPSVDVRLVRRGNSGANEIENPKDFVDTVLPDRLHHFFFLNGERFEHLLSADAYNDIEGAIKTILGIEIFERGLKHLPEVEKRLRTALRKVSDDRQGEIVERLESANEKKQAAEEELRNRDVNARKLLEETHILDARLRELQGSKELQSRRDELASQYAAKEKLKVDLLSGRLSLISTKGFLPFTEKAAKDVLARYQEMRERREIPRPVKLQFVEDLLASGTCVCGTDISQPGDPRSQLESWRARAGKAEVEERWASLGARLGFWVSEQMPEFRMQIEAMGSGLVRTVADLKVLNEKLSEVSKQLESADEEDIRDLEQRRRELGVQRDTEMREHGRLESDLRSANSVISRAEADLRSAKVQTAEAEVARRRVLAVEDARRALGEMMQLRTDDVRSDLDRRIRNVFSSVVKKRQVPTLTAGFDLLLQEEVEGQMVPKAMSTGEAQVLTLSFVGALADLARETYASSRVGPANPLVNAAGGIFPFVADAIFGTLDDAYRREVTRLLPQLAPQVLLFLSKAQSAGEVNEQLAARIGSIAVIDVHLARTDVSGETIMIDGREYPYVSLAGGEQDHSSLVSVLEPEVTA
jgi:DNA sulfur modification protein DndD